VPSHARHSVLVVDDDAAMREALEEVLRDLHYAVSAAADGLEGLEKLRGAEPPCAVLLDMKMPRLDGHGFLRALRADARLCRQPVVAMTGDDLDPPAQVQACLHKPFDIDEMIRILAGLCE